MKYCKLCDYGSKNKDMCIKCGAEMLDTPSYKYCVAKLNGAKDEKEFLSFFRHKAMDRHRHHIYLVFSGKWPIEKVGKEPNSTLKNLLAKGVIVHVAKWTEDENGFHALPSIFEYHEDKI